MSRKQPQILGCPDKEESQVRVLDRPLARTPRCPRGVSHVTRGRSTLRRLLESSRDQGARADARSSSRAGAGPTPTRTLACPMEG